MAVSRYSYTQGVILVDSEKLSVGAYYINADGNWELKEYNTLTDVLTLHAISTSLTLSEIYEGVSIPE